MHLCTLFLFFSVARKHISSALFPFSLSLFRSKHIIYVENRANKCCLLQNTKIVNSYESSLCALLQGLRCIACVHLNMLLVSLSCIVNALPSSRQILFRSFFFFFFFASSFSFEFFFSLVISSRYFSLSAKSQAIDGKKLHTCSRALRCVALLPRSCQGETDSSGILLPSYRWTIWFLVGIAKNRIQYGIHKTYALTVESRFHFHHNSPQSNAENGKPCDLSALLLEIPTRKMYTLRDSILLWILFHRSIRNEV